MFDIDDVVRPRIWGRDFKTKLDIFVQLHNSLQTYIDDRSDLVYYYIQKSDRILVKVNFIKVNLLQKFYFERGSLYKPFLMLSVLSIFIFSFFMFFMMNVNNLNNKSVGIRKAYGIKANLQNSILSDVSSQAPGSNLTKSSVKSNNYALINLYTVKKGDTLQSIATQFNTSANVIQWSNNLKSSTLTPGQKLNIVPVPGSTYTIQPGDTLQSISTKFNVPESSIESWNTLSSTTTLSVNPGEIIFIPSQTLSPIVNTPSNTNNIAQNNQNTPNNTTNLGQSTTTLPQASANGTQLAQISSNVSSEQHIVATPQGYYYNQGNPAWANIGLGYSGYTIGEVGCLITAVAMDAKYYGYNITPATIAENPSNFEGPLFNWNGLGIFNVTPLGSLFGGYVNWGEINSQLGQGHPVIVSVGYGYHYVLLTKVLSNGEYLMNDPALGANLIFNQHYSISSVTQAVLFTPN